MGRKPYIFPFQAMLIDGFIHFEGQVLHLSKSSSIASPKDSIWKNLKRTFQLYTPKKIKQEERYIDIVINGISHLSELDKYGYFYFRSYISDEDVEKIEDIKFFISEKRVYVNENIDFKKLIIKDNSFEKGIISDIDDTILVSHSKNFIKRTTTVGIKNAFSRKIVSESELLYRKLNSLSTQFFYVSNSETNLYLLIKWVIKLNKLPQGPIFLKKIRSYKNLLKLKKKKDFEEKYKHKIERIQFILESFPEKKFVLIGDSSQGDPEIYNIIANNYTNQIESIFIRGISKQKRTDQIIAISETLKKKGIGFYLYKNDEDLNNIYSF